MTTTLYIKKHNVTGLKYFGKTTRDVTKYHGSGLYWKNHLKTHGKDVETYWSMTFEDTAESQEFAEAFSEISNVW